MGASSTLEPWDSRDLEGLLRLQPAGPAAFRNRFASPNGRGTVFGGQLLAHALMAASMTVPDDRAATALQFMFLQSADPARPIESQVSVLQDGKRFASRHVRGTQPATADQPARVVFDAQTTFATPLPGPAHQLPDALRDTHPDALPPIEALQPETLAIVWRTLGYGFDSVALDLRMADVDRGLGLGDAPARLGFWIRTRETLADDPRLQAAAFAYLSDWWINFASVGIHVPDLDREGGRLHVASLNHAIWFHRPLRADRWLHFEVQSPAAGEGRGLSVATVHDLDGRLVASATQENLMTPGNL